MFAYRARGFDALVGVAQCLVHWGIFWSVVHFFRDNLWYVSELERFFGSLCWAWFAGIGAELLWCGHWQGEGASTSWLKCWQRAVFAFVFSGFAAFEPVLRHLSLSLAWCVWGTHLLVLVCAYQMLPKLFGCLLFGTNHRHRVIVVGEEDRVAELERVLHSRAGLGYQPVGWLGLSEAPQTGSGLPFIGGAQQFEEVIRKKGVDQVILAGGVREAQVTKWKTDCEKLGVRLVVAQKFKESELGGFAWEAQGEWCFGMACHEPLQNPINRVLKRGLDVCVAVPAVLFGVIPMAVLTWGMQRMQSPGPVFYRQWRHGRGNRPFRVWKFRTMHENPALAALQAKQNDQRIYPFARWLRRHSLDELPQFLNVLTGEMSVVGPRPHFVEHTGHFAEQQRYHVRSFVKPGITGLAQVNGCRGEVRCAKDMERRVRFDISYVERWSLWLDVQLIARTAWEVVVPPPTAY
jgi:exopolysaccharide biosynthesis polyprenyl glycosylphosphotransferase